MLSKTTSCASPGVPYKRERTVGTISHESIRNAGDRRAGGLAWRAVAGSCVIQELKAPLSQRKHQNNSFLQLKDMHSSF